MTEQEIIDAGKRIEQFLADPAVVQAFERLEKQYFEDFKKALTADERVLLHAKAIVLDDVRRALRAVKDAGTRAKIEAERRERTTPQSRGRRH